jgi:hypothetical protein
MHLLDVECIECLDWPVYLYVHQQASAARGYAPKGATIAQHRLVGALAE